MNLPRHSVAVVGVIIDHKGRILVAERADGTRWEPPGGVLELNESIVAGMKREVLEETGYEVESEGLVSVQKNMSNAVVALIFRGRVIGGQMRPSPETPQVAWWTREQVVAGMPAPFAQRVLDALDAGSPTIRTHDGKALLDDAAAYS